MKTVDGSESARNWELYQLSNKNDKNTSVDTVDNASFVNNNHINHFNMNQKDIPPHLSLVINQSTIANGGCSGTATLKKSKAAFKHMTVAKIFGKNYDIKKSLVTKNKKPQEVPKQPHKINQEKFYGLSWEDPIVCRRTEEKDTLMMSSTHLNAPHEGPKPFRTLSRSVGKLLRRNYSSVNISIPDPEYKVAYLGNVLTGWAKGEFLNVINPTFLILINCDGR